MFLSDSCDVFIFLGEVWCKMGLESLMVTFLQFGKLFFAVNPSDS